MFSGWVNHHQVDVMEYLQEENRVLKERLGGRRLCFTDIERRRLTRKAKALGHKVLSELCTIKGILSPTTSSLSTSLPDPYTGITPHPNS